MMSFELDNLFENKHKSFFGYKLKKKLNIRGRMTDKNEQKNSFRLNINFVQEEKAFIELRLYCAT